MHDGIGKVVLTRRKRLGRGYGSGKGGHTVGKGQKGQKTRKRLGILFEGVKVKKSLIKRLPFLRGKDRFKGKLGRLILDISKLEKVPSGTKVDLNYLIRNGFFSEKEAKKKGVKILGSSDISKKLTIQLPISDSAAKSIVKAGGKVINNG